VSPGSWRRRAAAGSGRLLGTGVSVWPPGACWKAFTRSTRFSAAKVVAVDILRNAERFRQPLGDLRARITP
jgi:hypothetical protein